MHNWRGRIVAVVAAAVVSAVDIAVAAGSPQHIDCRQSDSFLWSHSSFFLNQFGFNLVFSINIVKLGNRGMFFHGLVSCPLTILSLHSWNVFIYWPTT